MSETAPESSSSTSNSRRMTSGPGSGTGSPLDFVTNVLKSQFGNSEDFLMFERYFYYQTEELNSLKNACEQLQSTISKLQEEKRSLELQLVSEKVLRDQESKSSGMEIEKINIQQNAQIYAMKCETETWKRKAEAVATESTWLKDQMKTVEKEKNQAVQKLAEMKTNLQDFDRCRQSFDSYSRRQRALMQNVNQKMDELVNAKQTLEKITEGNQKQLDLMGLQLRNWKDERERCSRRIMALEDELNKAKAEIVQGNSKLGRAEIAEKKTAELVEKLINENKDLQNGLAILSNAVGDQIRNTDKELVEKVNELSTEFVSASKRLYLNESHFTPPQTNVSPYVLSGSPSYSPFYSPNYSPDSN